VETLDIKLLKPNPNTTFSLFSYSTSDQNYKNYFYKLNLEFMWIRSISKLSAFFLVQYNLFFIKLT